MPKTEKHLCRHRITKFATLEFFVSSQTELKFIYKRPEIKKEMMSLILMFFPIDSMSKFLTTVPT